MLHNVKCLVEERMLNESGMRVGCKDEEVGKKYGYS